MDMFVLIENKPEGKVSASVIGWSDVTAQGKTEDEALDHLRRVLSGHLKHAKVVQLELPPEQPWLHTAGMFRDDPFADEFQAVIAEFRREQDRQDGLAENADSETT